MQDILLSNSEHINIVIEIWLLLTQRTMYKLRALFVVQFFTKCYIDCDTENAFESNAEINYDIRE